MLLYLYGPDTYRRQKTLEQSILAKYREKHTDIALAEFDVADEGALSKLAEFTASQSLFASAKLGVIYNPNELPDELAKFLKTVVENKSVTLVVVADKKLPKAFDFLLKEPTKSWEFEKLTGTPLVSYIAKEAKERGLTPTKAVVDELVFAYGDNLWAIVGELEKMALGGAPELTAPLPNFFGLISAVKAPGPASRRLKALFYLVERHEPAMVFNMIASQVSGSLKVKMADYDIAIKSGKLEYPEALLDFVLATE